MANAGVRIVAAVLVLTAGWSSALPASDEATQIDYTGHRLVSVTPVTAAQVSLLSTLADKLQLDVWQEATAVNASALLRLRPEVAAEFEASVARTGLRVTTKSSNLQEAIENERREMRFTTYSTTPMRFERYLKYAEFSNALKQYARKYDHVTYLSIGRSYEGRNIIAAHIKTKENLPIVFLECGIHAREWISHSACLYIIDQLATQYDKDDGIRHLLSRYEWRIHPIVNPDGYDYTHNTDRLWRKTRSKSRFSSKCRGADANRNFDIGGFCRIRASSNPCQDTYCGDHAFSEPESRAVRDALWATQGRTEFYFSIHSFGQLWMFPYAHSDVPVPEYNQLMNISLRAKEAIRKVQGTVYTVGPISKTIYQVSGSSVDWAYEKMGVTKSFAVELQPSWLTFQGNLGFLLPAKDIFPTVKETWEGIRAAIA
ncbi:zinc carboxypeptidase-like isoform X2 [Dermacentor andersoni]|uniref:zinc carboxypeptidase-like isoform X2 n=1 Tax=Dermacentor andersoni TaxID=34620 RepID=UPI003B3B8AAB